MLGADDTCLVIVDVQEKLTAVMHERERLVRNLAILAEAAGLLRLPTVYCEQYPRALGRTVEELRGHLDAEEAVEKMAFSCMAEPEFVERLAATECRNVLLAGIEAHICVCQTAVDLLEKGYNVHLVTDAVSSRTAENRDIAIRRMESEGAVLSTTEMALFELLGTAEHEQFKRIAGLIK
ncbi:Isochorismatase family protein [Anaerohalosphaera lusitana]|uniref:Isochorismatase family protein n=2 Tax=Anaerohalosphaera lusitana TaxID=1936003 RepID=A0A1U9NPA1_9BACT|nr:Isochorismatase family protein [Anaerohalosphaera lusitana]